MTAVLEKERPSNQQKFADTVVLDEESVHVPAWVVNLRSFLQWTETDEFPEKFPRICYLAGEIWIDMRKEQVFSHNQIKNEYSFVVTGLNKAENVGRFFPDGVLLTNIAAGLNCKPDGVFVTNEAFAEGRVRLVESAKSGFVEL